MKRAIFVIAAVAAMAFAVSAQTASVGSTLADIALLDTGGKKVMLNDFKGTNGAVLIFVSAQCPVVRSYNERMNQLAADYKAKGINVIGINSNATESADWVKSHSDSTHKFPVLIDKGAVLADKLGATVTPEAYFIDAKNTILYHGAIDNSRSGEGVTDRYLTAAFDAALAGKKVERTRANAFGCSIKRSGE